MIGNTQIGSLMMNYENYVRNSGIKNYGQVDEFSGILAQRAAAAEESAPVSLESMLKAKYPNLVYNVGDAGSSLWRTRNDYPHELLFEESERAAEMLENWKPAGANPANQRYLPVAPGSKAVMIHPKAQERMEQDPEFAKEVMERIESWWAYDIARNEAIAPGHTVGMSQAVAIGEDGEITNVLACGGGDAVRNNRNGNHDEDEYDWWAERMARHAMFMQLWLTGKANFSNFSFLRGSSFGSFAGNANLGGLMSMQSAQSAERELAGMLQGNDLKNKLGDTVAGVPTDEILDNTWAEIEKGRSIVSMFMML